ncbi:flagellar hook assembly protein FlgD [Ramlibacter sp.]|uniref:flagellar hook assembly protein FlgD n=1 Tax=Ramlibacter sp. TaxID=1917967 RepID=UPI002B9F6887|nr:flagellar hook assembly protein FlgD [Ramlibacter sp.]HWI82105.1 flagellar hook assembly protein FlgD [Ramlibacter sp.]
MPIAALSPSDPAAAASAAPAPSQSAASEQRFLKLLITQLNNQDPLNPMDNAQLTSQLAQMSTVSGIEKTNATLQTLLAQSSSAQMLQAASLVGRAVVVPGGQLALDGGAASFAIDLPASAASARALITDAAGNPVRTIDLGSLPAGLHSQAWDGRNDAGQAMPAGLYRVDVVAANGANPVSAATLVAAQVRSVGQDAAGITLQLSGGRSAALADVRMLQ